MNAGAGCGSEFAGSCFDCLDAIAAGDSRSERERRTRFSLISISPLCLHCRCAAAAAAPEKKGSGALRRLQYSGRRI